MIVIAGKIMFDSRADRDAAVEASTPYQAATREEEPGCLAYVFAADPAVDTEMHVYELWKDAPTLEAHFEHENYFKMRETLGSHKLVGTDIWKHRTDAQDRVYGEDRVASARFWSVE